MPFNELLPLALALAASVLFALSLQLQSIGLRQVDNRDGSLFSMASTMIFLMVLAPFVVERWHWSSGAILIFAMIGLIRPFLSMNLAMAGLKLLGPTLASTFGSLSPIFGALLGILYFGENMTWIIAASTLAIIAGVTLLAHGGKVQLDWPLWAIFLPLGASAIRSVGHAMTKFGMEEVPSALFAALIGTSVSTMIAFATRGLGNGGRKNARAPLRWRSHHWFFWSGILNGFALLSLNSALHIGRLIVVVPLLATSPVVTLLLSRFIFRQEKISFRKFLALAIIVPAVMMIALSK